MRIEDLKKDIESCYDIEFIDHNSDNLVITFTPASAFFLYKHDLSAKKLCVSSKVPNYYLYNPGSMTKKFSKFILAKSIKHVIVIGSSKAGFAGLLWGKLLNDLLKPKGVKVFILAFSPQTQLYPLNDGLGFPSYQKFYQSLKSNRGLEKYAELYGDLAELFRGSDAEGLLIYPEHNICDRTEALKLDCTNIKLISIDSPLHGTIFPFMLNTDNDKDVWNMVDKLYSRIDQDLDLKNTLPDSPRELFNIISAIKTPSIEQLCASIFTLLEHRNNIAVLKQYDLI